MAIRSELELRAAAVNVNAAAITNDSVLEHTVLKAERALTASGAATTLLPNVKAKQAVADGVPTIPS